MRFGVVMADPPWSYGEFLDGSRGPRRHYATQGNDWIAKLPVAAVAAPRSVLLLWATIPKLPDAFRVMETWGFIFRSALTWVKMSRAACPRIGLGYHARGCVELLLIGGRGDIRAPLPADRPEGVLFNPIGEHSAKPERQYEIAEAYAGPYLEMFHRPRGGGLAVPREGWTFLGDEVDGHDIRDALTELAALPNAGPMGRRERAIRPAAPALTLELDGAG